VASAAPKFHFAAAALNQASDKISGQIGKRGERPCAARNPSKAAEPSLQSRQYRNYALRTSQTIKQITKRVPSIPYPNIVCLLSFDEPRNVSSFASGRGQLHNESFVEPSLSGSGHNSYPFPPECNCAQCQTSFATPRRTWEPCPNQNKPCGIISLLGTTAKTGRGLRCYFSE
jgi:hypothetical protein